MVRACSMQGFDLNRRGNELPSGEFPHCKNGLKGAVIHGDPGYMVDWADLENKQSQVKAKSQERPVDDETLDLPAVNRADYAT